MNEHIEQHLPTGSAEPALTLSALIDAMYPDLEAGQERERLRNATRVLAQKGAIVPVEDVSGSGRHRRYDPLWVPLGRSLLLLKDAYKVHTDVLVQIGKFLWEKRDMIEYCPDPVVILGEFAIEGTDEWEEQIWVMSSAEQEQIFYGTDENRRVARHCVAVAIDRA